MKNILKGIGLFITNKRKRTDFLARHGFYNYMSDEDFLKMRFKAIFGYDLDLENPKGYNEKLQWLKLYDRKPLYTTLVDKYEVKKYIADLIGEEYVIKTLGIYDKFDDIDFEKLPNQFVMKCTHDSGGIVICKDKTKLDIKKAKKKIEKSLKTNYYYRGREWPYKNVKPRIIIEEYLSDGSGKSINDYKFFCFDGVAESVMVCTERETGHPKFYFFDKEWNLKKYNIRGKEAPEGFTLPKPDCIDEMFALAEKLSKGIPYVRVDLYCIDGLVYFGEMTFYPDSGFDANLLKESDAHWGEMLILPEKRG